MRFYLSLILLLILIPGVLGQGYLGDRILEGETKQVMVADKVYDITLVTVSDSRMVALFKVNGEISKDLEAREKHVFSDGSTLFVSNIFPNEAEELNGYDLVEFTFYATGGGLAKDSVPYDDDQSFDDYSDVLNFLEQITNLVEGDGTQTASQSYSQSVPGAITQNQCLIDAECNDKIGCTADACIGGQCVYVPQAGCSLDDSVCVAMNTRMTLNKLASYCAGNGDWEGQKELGAECRDNYECLSNLCLDGKCMRMDDAGDAVITPEPQVVVSVPDPAPVPEGALETLPENTPQTPPVIENPSPVLIIEEETIPSPQEKPSVGGFFSWILDVLVFWN